MVGAVLQGEGSFLAQGSHSRFVEHSSIFQRSLVFPKRLLQLRLIFILEYSRHWLSGRLFSFLLRVGPRVDSILRKAALVLVLDPSIRSREQRMGQGIQMAMINFRRGQLRLSFWSSAYVPWSFISQ